MFIVIEGLDGTGKSTVSKALAEALNAELLTTPDTSLKPARETIDSAYQHTPLARQLFYASSVVQLSDKIKALRDSGKRIVVDRYWLSTQVYHAWKTHHQHLLLKEVEGRLQVPDMTIYLTLPLALRSDRIKGRSDNTQEDNLTLTLEADRSLNETYRSYKDAAIVGQWLEIDSVNEVEKVISDIKSALR